MDITLQIPPLNGIGEPKQLQLNEGSVVFVVGANGAGKSALVTHLCKTAGSVNLVKISAHRQSWLNSSSVDLTPKTRKDLQINIANKDRRDDSRWKDDFAAPRSQVALFDLANAQNKVSRETMDLLKGGNVEEAKTLAKQPSPIEAINDILAVSALTVRLSINGEGDVLASHGNGASFSITQLSDGERNAVMLAAQILTAEPSTLFVIDEPERHLHRSITEPMLSALFEKRRDCGFLIATHEPELPNSNHAASVLIVRACTWNGQTASGWDVDVLSPGLEIPDETRKAILGSRRNIMFIEGERQSLDFPLVSALFPGLSIVPQGSCREVEKSVKGLTGTTELHWLKPFGLIDRDDRTAGEVAELQANDIFALEVSAIESIFYSTSAIEAMASAQAELFGIDSTELTKQAYEAAIAALDEDTKNNLAARRSEKSARNKLLGSLPDWKEIRNNKGANITVEVLTTFIDEMKKIEDSIESNKLDAIVSRFAIKKTPIPSAIAHALRFTDKRHYEEAVVTLAKKDEAFGDLLRSKLGPVVEKVGE